MHNLFPTKSVYFTYPIHNFDDVSNIFHLTLVEETFKQFHKQ